MTKHDITLIKITAIAWLLLIIELKITDEIKYLLPVTVIISIIWLCYVFFIRNNNNDNDHINFT